MPRRKTSMRQGPIVASSKSLMSNTARCASSDSSCENVSADGRYAPEVLDVKIAAEPPVRLGPFGRALAISSRARRRAAPRRARTRAARRASCRACGRRARGYVHVRRRLISVAPRARSDRSRSSRARLPATLRIGQLTSAGRARRVAGHATRRRHARRAGRRVAWLAFDRDRFAGAGRRAGSAVADRRAAAARDLPTDVTTRVAGGDVARRDARLGRQVARKRRVGIASGHRLPTRVACDAGGRSRLHARAARRAHRAHATQLIAARMIGVARRAGRAEGLTSVVIVGDAGEAPRAARRRARAAGERRRRADAAVGPLRDRADCALTLSGVGAGRAERASAHRRGARGPNSLAS